MSEGSAGFGRFGAALLSLNTSNISGYTGIYQRLNDRALPGISGSYISRSDEYFPVY